MNAIERAAKEVAEARKALLCLALEVPPQVHADVRAKVEAAFAALAAEPAERADRTAPMTSSAWEFCCNWYRPDDVEQSIERSFAMFPDGACDKRPPVNVRSREFAEWLCDQYRLAMNKGIQIGKSQAKPAPQEEQARG